LSNSSRLAAKWPKKGRRAQLLAAVQNEWHTFEEARHTQTERDREQERMMQRHREKGGVRQEHSYAHT
jgi:hypothetical protein